MPSELGLRLHASYAGPRLLLVEPERTHNTLMGDPHAEWWTAVAEFWREGASERR